MTAFVLAILVAGGVEVSVETANGGTFTGRAATPSGARFRRVTSPA